MDILIKDMQMPTGDEMLCINIFPDGKVTSHFDLRCAPVAKAVPVPPHGDLIERDALTISTAVPLDGKPYRYVHIDNIKGAPTIIPASGKDVDATTKVET